MRDYFVELVDELASRDRGKAAGTGNTRRAPRRESASAVPPGGFDAVLQKAQQLRDAIPSRRNYRAELDGLLSKAMDGFTAGKITALEVAKLEDMVERARHDGIAKGLI